MITKYYNFLETFVPKRIEDRSNDVNMPYMYKKYKYSITSNTIYPDNDHGDFDESDTLEKDIDTLEDILMIAKHRYYIGKEWESSSPDTDYITGNITYYNLHINHVDNTQLTDEEKDYITEQL